MAVILIQDFSGAGLSSGLKPNNYALQRREVTHQGTTSPYTYQLHRIYFSTKLNLPVLLTN